MVEQTLDRLINMTLVICQKWIQPGEDGKYRFIDPLDQKEMSAHYGATHMAAACIIQDDISVKEKGYRLLESILERWETSLEMQGFHNDFNNFALCVIWDYLTEKKLKKMLAEKIKETVIVTPDSNNPTINWLPMRWHVNCLRYQWTGDMKYKKLCDKCKREIVAATYEDGFIDDLLPKGVSFNLQYDVATVAVMQYLRVYGEKIDLSRELGALMNAVAPDGDINYLGRGTNQIFAWGLWIYLLLTSGQMLEGEKALKYLDEHLPNMLKHNNMMLNDWNGAEKYMWWDYHYCSVYTAHLLLWLVLARRDIEQKPIVPVLSNQNDSGVHIYKDKDYFVVVLDGRKEYLAERGPVVAALWTETAGMVVKGAFGPWQGAFGNDHFMVDVTLRNYFGLIEVSNNKDYSRNKIIHKFLTRLLPNVQCRVTEKISPLFTPVIFRESKSYIELTWKNSKKVDAMFVIPALCKIDEFHVNVDGKPFELNKNMAIRNQYKWIWEYQSRIVNGSEWRLKVKK